MLKYGVIYLEQNDLALRLLVEGMTPAAIALAKKTAPHQDEPEAVEDDEYEYEAA
ncbi:hypothetical protein KOAAANKH_00707 [Brevundimonas sp. NIBR10]|uniref:hypothetical protein n=1 Tax=Brevundimonas sp. NIBR10 TaxID=3015997 RepID=UPI0022F1DC3E|nr:hypothetical protein [Brevundimonas sp. NIBR10]WGM45843.1 hypothetical protein KOAAANKH_00707 [Brevundimonas sp. NIBR10]